MFVLRVVFDEKSLVQLLYFHQIGTGAVASRDANPTY